MLKIMNICTSRHVAIQKTLVTTRSSLSSFVKLTNWTILTEICQSRTCRTKLNVLRAHIKQSKSAIKKQSPNKYQLPLNIWKTLTCKQQEIYKKPGYQSKQEKVSRLHRKALHQQQQGPGSHA